jgi:hypothetical protein
VKIDLPRLSGRRVIFATMPRYFGMTARDAGGFLPPYRWIAGRQNRRIPRDGQYAVIRKTARRQEFPKSRNRSFM